jgi:hypothetical protein
MIENGMSNEYVGQFALSMREISTPPGFREQAFGPWVLYTHGTLPVLDVYTLDNVRIGWAVGYWIDIASEELLTERIVLPVASGALLSQGDADVVLEEFLYSFGGRHVCILLYQAIQRVYLDAAGSMSCVYSVHALTLASTPALY